MSVKFGAVALFVSVMGLAPRTAQAAGSMEVAAPTARLEAPAGLCAPGYVWRRANATDRVCVTPEVRRRVAEDNAAAIGRTAQNTIAPGAAPRRCAQGYVWRMANGIDYVCVTPQARAQAAEDNAAAATRLAHSFPVRTLYPEGPRAGLGSPAPPALLSLPSPPAAPGCYALNSRTPPRWDKVACLTPEELSHVPHVVEGGTQWGTLGIQSQPVNLGPRYGVATAGLGAGSVTVYAPTPNANWQEADSSGGPYQYSVQLNTNQFPSTCHFPPGLNYRCFTGNTAGVQFTYQTNNGHPSGYGNHDIVCISVVDVSLQKYYVQCQNVGHAPGFWQPSQSINIIGYVDFVNHNLVLVAQLPWHGPLSVVTTDYLGLCWALGPSPGPCAWNQVSGTMLGEGNGSQAVFAPNTSVTTKVYAQTCVATVPTSVCDASVDTGTLTPSPVALLNPFHGASAWGFGTVETNNLNLYYFGPPPSGTPPPAVCSGVGCSMTFTASSSPPK